VACHEKKNKRSNIFPFVLSQSDLLCKVFVNRSTIGTVFSAKTDESYLDLFRFSLFNDYNKLYIKTYMVAVMECIKESGHLKVPY